MNRVKIVSVGQFVRVENLTPAMRDKLADTLTCTIRKQVRDRGQIYYDMQPERFYTIEPATGFLVSLAGLRRRIYTFLKANGAVVEVTSGDTLRRPDLFTLDRERLFRQQAVTFRYRQEELIQKVVSSPCGIIQAPPGFGKSFVIAVLAVMLPHARIDVITKRVAVLKDRLYPALCRVMPSVGIVGGGLRRTGHRVQLYSADSLHHSKFDADIVLGDEAHELAAERVSELLGRYHNARRYGFTATPTGRADGSDLRTEALFGPVIFSMSYQEGVDNGVVVPLEIAWTPVQSAVDPAADVDDSVDRARLVVWQNDQRNDLIARDARSYSDDTQVLVLVDKVEHALELKKRLPEFQLVYGDRSRTTDAARLARRGVDASLLVDMTPEIRNKLARAFETGTLKKAIATSVWNTGVDFTELSVLIRGDASDSPVANYQGPGRASRLGDGKQAARVHDYTDEHNPVYAKRARRRRRDYQSHQWRQFTWTPTCESLTS
jgi:superfamily II DNA or RNA helicase